MINVKQRKRRCEEALELSGRNAIENGEDITKYFGTRCATILEDVTESDGISEFDSDMNIEESQTRPVFDGRKVHEIQRKSRKKLFIPIVRPLRPHSG